MCANDGGGDGFHVFSRLSPSNPLSTAVLYTVIRLSVHPYSVESTTTWRNQSLRRRHVSIPLRSRQTDCSYRIAPMTRARFYNPTPHRDVQDCGFRLFRLSPSHRTFAAPTHYIMKCIFCAVGCLDRAGSATSHALHRPYGQRHLVFFLNYIHILKKKNIKKNYIWIYDSTYVYRIWLYLFMIRLLSIFYDFTGNIQT